MFVQNVPKLNKNVQSDIIVNELIYKTFYGFSVSIRCLNLNSHRVTVIYRNILLWLKSQNGFILDG